MPERFHALPLRITGLSVVFTLLVLAVAITPAVWAQANVTVTPSNVLQITSPISNGQIAVYVTRGNNSPSPETSTARYTFVPGPAAPPLGSGSLHMQAGSGTGAGNGGKVWVSSTDLHNTPLGSVTLSYSTYVVNNNSTVTAPSVNMYVDIDGNGSRDVTLVYEPYWQGTIPSLNTWQTWNAAVGRWWDNTGTVASGAGGGLCNRTLAEIVAGTEPGGCPNYPAYPNAQVVNWGLTPSVQVIAGDSIGSTGWVNFDGYIDAVNTGLNIYNFEPPTTVYVDSAWAGTTDLTGTIIVAHRTPFGTAPFVATCPGLNPHYFGLDGFASQADVTAALGAGYTGLVVDCNSLVPTPPGPGPAVPTPVNAAAAPLCSLIGGGTNSIVRADVPDNTVTRGSVFCQIITEHSQYVRSAAEIGVPQVIALNPVQAVEVFGLLHTGDSWPDFNNPVTVCLAGSGRIIYLSALQAPRQPAWLPSTASSGYTCASISDAGTVVLVP